MAAKFYFILLIFLLFFCRFGALHAIFFILGRHDQRSWLQTMFFGISESNDGQFQ